MVRNLKTSLMFVLANAIGLVLAMIILPEFKIGLVGFVVASVLFSLVEVIGTPMITKLSDKNIPSLKGGVALVTTFLGLGITAAILPGMTVGGIATWLAATLLVWLGALIAHIALPMVMFKESLHTPKS